MTRLAVAGDLICTASGPALMMHGAMWLLSTLADGGVRLRTAGHAVTLRPGRPAQVASRNATDPVLRQLLDKLNNTNPVARCS